MPTRQEATGAQDTPRAFNLSHDHSRHQANTSSHIFVGVQPWLTPPTSPQRQSGVYAIARSTANPIMPRQRVTGQGRPRARWVASPRRKGIRRPPQFLYCYNRHPHGIRETAVCLWTPRVYWRTSMHCPGPIAIHPPHHDSGPGRGNKHLSPTVLATPHSPSSTQSTHHSPRNKLRFRTTSHSKLPRLRDTRPRMAAAPSPPSRATDTTRLPRTTPRETTTPTPSCHGFPPGLPITPPLHLLQASQIPPLQRPLPRPLLRENKEPPS